MQVIQLLVAVVVGALIPFQIAANKRFGVGAPVEAYGAAANFVVGAIAIVLILTAARTPLISRAQLSNMPWWAFLGGFCGLFYVYGALKIAPRIGPVLFLSLLILGQMGCSLVLEQFGVLYDKSPITAGRVVGVAFLLVGVYLIRSF